MTVEGERFITEMLKAIRGDIAGLSDRVLNMELRQTAMEHRLTGIDAHLIAIQHSVDGLGKRMERVERRLELVDGE